MGKFFGALFKWILKHPEVVTVITDAVKTKK